LREIGLVTKIESGAAIVKIIPGDDCGDCNACSIGGKPGERELRIYAQSLPPVGSQVEIAIAEKAVVNAAFTIFFLPLLAFLSGYFSGESLAAELQLNTSAGAWSGAFVFLGAAISWLRFKDSRAGRSGPSIVRVINAGANP
jgi:sigma-E factor negative regulatory protein RseC